MKRSRLPRPAWLGVAYRARSLGARGPRPGPIVRSAGRVLSVWLLIGFVATAASAGAAAQAGSEGEVGVLAQGVATPPPGQVAWRVVEDTAEAGGRAGFELRAVGFAIATEGAMRLTDQASGREVQLEPGEASFVPDASTERRESLSGQDVGYLRIALVQADKVTDPGGDTLRFSGEPFLSPSVERGLTLAYGRPRGDEEQFLPNSAGRMLVLVLDGAVELSVDSGLPSVLEAGDAIDVVGTGSIRAAGSDAFYAVASIDLNVPGSDMDEDGFDDGPCQFPDGPEPNAPDGDGDGLSDQRELICAYPLATNPNDPDTDDDGLNDYEERFVYGTIPVDPDGDRDGFSDGEEIAADADPHDGNDTPER
jgi:hypothetical protein